MKITFTFTLISNIKVLVHIVNNRVAEVEILKKSNIPPRYYNSYLNQANTEALKMWDYVLNVVEHVHDGNPKIIETSDFVYGIIYSYIYNEQIKDQLAQV